MITFYLKTLSHDSNHEPHTKSVNENDLPLVINYVAHQNVMNDLQDILTRVNGDCIKDGLTPSEIATETKPIKTEINEHMGYFDTLKQQLKERDILKTESDFKTNWTIFRMGVIKNQKINQSVSITPIL